MRLLLLLLLSASVGCASVEPPGVTPLGAQLDTLTNDGLRLAVDLRVSNPNAVALPLSGIGYTLAVEGVDVVRGDAPAGSLARVPAHGEADLSLPVEVRWADLIDAKEALVAGGGDFGYVLRGEAKYEPPGLAGAVLPSAVPFEYAGELPLREALRDPRNLANPEARELAQALFTRFFR